MATLDGYYKKWEVDQKYKLASSQDSGFGGYNLLLGETYQFTVSVPQTDTYEVHTGPVAWLEYAPVVPGEPIGVIVKIEHYGHRVFIRHRIDMRNCVKVERLIPPTSDLISSVGQMLKGTIEGRQHLVLCTHRTVTGQPRWAILDSHGYSCEYSGDVEHWAEIIGTFDEDSLLPYSPEPQKIPGSQVAKLITNGYEGLVSNGTAYAPFGIGEDPFSALELKETDDVRLLWMEEIDLDNYID